MFSFKVVPYKTSKGKLRPIILVTGDNPEVLKKNKDTLVKYGAQWLSSFGTFGWWGSTKDEENKKIIDEKVKPALEFLVSQEEGNEQDIVSVLDDIINKLSSQDTEAEVEAAQNAYMSTKQIKDKIQSFKEKLVNTFNDKDFLAMITPLIKFKKAQGYKFSLLNTILIWVQDPNASMVKSKPNWEKMNRTVKPGARALGLFVPTGGKSAYKTKEEKEAAKARFMQVNHIESEADMTPGDEERLRHFLTKRDNTSGFKMSFAFYDIKDTVQMEGKEDIVGSNVDVQWFDNTGKETEAVKEKIYSLLQVVAESGVDVSKTKDLGGALGVSKGGKIETLEDASMNSNYFLTLTHEFAHELLHQKYLKSKNTEFSAFYQGKERGRGFIEQQAELTAWIVCQFYGYDMPTAINYNVAWGMDAKNAVFCFDTVASVSDFIINKINAKIQQMRQGNNVQESINKNMINEVNYSGADIARMVGAGELYQKGMEDIQNDENLRAEGIKKFKELTEKINGIDKRNTQERFD